ncbi:MAG: hypothetical protein APR63_05700 [Desulfuromonas sp. SDB]|nr:MAG: hypothetical protein APR63_05700 [Desulfuromonas sp. SDB]
MEKFKIMIADDDPTVITYLSDILLEQGYDVVREDNGNDAVDTLFKEEFHLVIIDVAMPGMSGYAICKQLRENSQTKGLPVILLAVDVDSSSRIEAWRSGANIILNKPINKAEILLIVENFITQNYYPEYFLSNIKGFGGKIESFPVVDLLQFMEMGGKTGCIKLKSVLKTAVVYFDSGTIVHAESGRLKGSNAIYHIISWEEGLFTYAPNAQPEEVTIRETLSHLLLEGVRLMDEESRDNVAVDELTNALLKVGMAEDAERRIESISQKVTKEKKKIFEILVIDMWSEERKNILNFIIDGFVDYLGKEVGITKKHSAISSFARIDISPEVSLEIVVSSGKKKFNLLWQVFLEQANALILMIDPRLEDTKDDVDELTKRLKPIQDKLPVVVLSPVGEKAGILKLEKPKWFAVPEYYMVNIEEVLKYIFDYTESQFVEQVEMKR